MGEETAGWYVDDHPSNLDREARRHMHVYIVEQVRFCLDGCEDAHLDVVTLTHHTYAYLASTRANAEWYIRAHATTDPLRAWEVWEQAVDEYHPFELPDDECDYWQYAGDGTALNPYEWWARYSGPLYGWEWQGADIWRQDAEARQSAG